MSDPLQRNAKAPPVPSLSVQEVAGMVGGRVEGEADLRVGGIAPLQDAGEGELGFLARRRYLKHLGECRARAVLVSEALADEAAPFAALVIVPDAHGALPPLLAAFYPPRVSEAGIHPTAVFGKGTELGEGISVGPYAVIGDAAALGNGVRIEAHSVVGEGCVLGEDSVLHPHVVLYPGTVLGRRVILHAGVRLGVDGFGYVPGAQGHTKVPQVGACVVEDDVEIGANTTIDRGSIGRTVVGKGTKIDNLVHLAHNVRVGEHVFMAAMAGISGSTTIGDRALIGGQAGAVGHIQIGEGAQVGAQSGIIGDIPPGETISGYPARNNREYLRAMGALFKLPEAMRRIRALEKRLQALGEGGEKS